MGSLIKKPPIENKSLKIIIYEVTIQLKVDFVAAGFSLR